MDATTLTPNRQFSFTRHRPPKKKPGAEPWPPAELALPDTIEEIEAGRPPKQRSLLPPADLREAKLDRLLADVPSVQRASRLRPPMPQHADDCWMQWW